MSAITYRETKYGTSVLLDGRVVGRIHQTLNGMYHYAPKGSRGYGELFKNMAECKRTLEARGTP